MGTDFSFKLLEIQPSFILIKVIFSKQKPNPNLWVETLEDLVCSVLLLYALALVATALREIQF